MQDGELRRGGEHRHQAHEVAAPEPPLGFRPDEQHPVLAVDEPLLDQIARDRPGGYGQRRAAAASPARAARRPASPAGTARATAGRRCAWALAGARHRLDEAAAPREQQPGREQQLILVQREEQAVPPGPGPPPAAPEALQEPRDRERRVDLDHPVQVADIHAEFQRGGGHDDAVPALGEGLLRAPPLVQRQRGVHQVRR